MNESVIPVQLLQLALRAMRSGESARAQRALDTLYRETAPNAHVKLSDMCLAEYSSKVRGRFVNRTCQRRLGHRGNHKATGRLTSAW